MIYISDELSHYGVKGMKWGVRKQPEHSANKRMKDNRTNRTKKAISYYRKSIKKIYTDLYTNQANGVGDDISYKKANSELLKLAKQMIRDYPDVVGTNDLRNANKVAKDLNKYNNLNLDALSTSVNDAVKWSNNHSEVVRQQALQDSIMQQQSQLAIQEANRAASLSMTYGMNPFMFG